MTRRLAILLVMIAAIAASPFAQTKKTSAKKQQTTRVVKKQVKKTTVTKKPASKKKTAAAGNKSISSLKNERAKVQQEIANQKRKYQANERNVKERLKNLMALNMEIVGKRRTIDSIKLEIDTLNMQISRLDGELKTLEAELADRKEKYVRSLRYMHRNSSMESQLMFIFSAKNFTEMYRRMRFTREYATYQRSQGEIVKAKQVEVTAKREEVKAARAAQKKLLARGEHERKQLEGKQVEQETAVKNLKNQQKTIQSIIAEQQKKDARLNAEIERLIAIEIEKARQRAIAEEKRRAEEEARLQGKNSKSASKTKKRKSEPYRIDSEDRRISGSFASNKGRLPAPVVGPYRIINRFGQYNVDGLKNVRLDNKGINIEVQPGAQVRSIFDGEVSAVFSLGGITGVMIRHGHYISVYCNLTGITVRKGQKVTTRQVIGRVDNTNILEFQLRNETKTLNPEAWIIR